VVKIIAIALIGFLLGAGFASAGPLTKFEVERGQALAKRLCANCHLVNGAQQQANVDVPSFREIANKSAQSEGAIMARIVLPSHPMPEIPITKQEIADLAAYIMSLRDSDTRPGP
jgi:mono/diheme cytochrome c family protein